MSFNYTDGKLEITFGPNSRVQDLFRDYADRFEEAASLLLPDETLDLIYDSFLSDLDPEGIIDLYSDELNGRIKNHSTSVLLGILNEDDVLYEDLEISDLGSIRKAAIMDASMKSEDFTTVDSCKLCMAEDIAKYMQARALDFFYVKQDRSPNIERLEETTMDLKEGLESAMLNFQLSDGQMFSYDREIV